MAAARVLVALQLSIPMQWQHLSSVNAFSLSASSHVQPLFLKTPFTCQHGFNHRACSMRFHDVQPRRIRGGASALAPGNADDSNAAMEDLEDVFETFELESQMEVQFKNITLLRQALTHASAVMDNLESNQRLEFLGDAVLEMIISAYLFEKYPEHNEGQLTSLRTQVVNTKALAKVARQQELGRWILMSKAEDSTGGRNKENILADIVESIIAAVYVDQGYTAAREFTLRWFCKVLNSAAIQPSGTDYKTKLQELSRRLGIATPQYFVTEKGPKHNQKFTAHVLANNNRLGWGVGRTKKAAEQAAAEYSIVVLEEKSPVELALYSAGGPALDKTDK